MQRIFLTLFVTLFLYSCEKWNLKDDILSENNIQLNSIQKVIITGDNGLLIAGVNNSKETFIKTDANFGTIWRKDDYDWGNYIYSGGWGQPFYGVDVVNIFQNENDNFICVASVTQGGCVIYSSVMIIELSQEGEELKKMEIQDFTILDAIKSADGGYLLLGYRLLKVDKNFNINWEKDYWAMDLGIGNIINTNDGRYALTCWNYNDESFIKILNTDGDESFSERYSFNDTPFNETGNDLIQLKDKGFIIIGRTRNHDEPWDMDCGATRINSSGAETWTKKFGSGDDEWLEKIIYSSDDEFIVQGKVGFPNDEIQKTILLKMNITGQIADSCTVDRIEMLLYNPHNYFIKADKIDDDYYRFNKIPFKELCNPAGD